MLEQLKKKAINVTYSTPTVWPSFKEEYDTCMSSEVFKFRGKYGYNNSTIAFVADDEYYVTPFTREDISAVRNAGLRYDSSMYVPFSSGQYPKFQKEKWDQLREAASESYRRDFEVDCGVWYEKHNIRPLSIEILKKCFRIPINGIEVTHPRNEKPYFVHPLCGTESYIDCTINDILGKWCNNNSRVVFINNDGHTYIAKGYWIVGYLKAAGYKEGDLWVPFSNGESIVNPALAAQWRALPEK